MQRLSSKINSAKKTNRKIVLLGSTLKKNLNISKNLKIISDYEDIVVTQNQAKKFNKDVTLYLIGIDPNYQKLGVTAIIFNSFIQTLKGKGIQICRRTPELTDNISIDKIWKNFNPKLIKTRSTYKLNLN